MAYTKKLKTIEVYLMLDSEGITIEDTAEDNKASRALAEFKRYDTMHYETTEDDVKVMNEIPYHAVQYIAVTETDASIEKADPYGCGGEGAYTLTDTDGEVLATNVKVGDTLTFGDLEGGNCLFGRYGMAVSINDVPLGNDDCQQSTYSFVLTEEMVSNAIDGVVVVECATCDA